MNKEKCCIVFTIHKDALSGYEEKSFNQLFKIFGGKWPIKIVIPNNINTTYYDKYKGLFEYIKVNPNWLDSPDSFNSTCCNPNYWKLFNNYEYVMIYQTDSWCFYDNLDYFLNLGYDFYGAPWPFANNQVGNSGTCLRKVDKMIEISSKYEFINDSWGSKHEDVWFCIDHGNEMNICPWEIAVNFSLELSSIELLNEIKNIPMGLHGTYPWLLELWDEDGSKFLQFKKEQLGI